MEERRTVTVVSGLPRSGTSLMMQMLGAGGMPVLSDGMRAGDEDNPRGYLELEAVKRMRKDAAWLSEAQGKAVKVVHLCCATCRRTAPTALSSCGGRWPR